MGLSNQDVVAVSDSPGNSETFRIVRKDGDLNRVRIQASNGLFLQVLFLLVALNKHPFICHIHIISDLTSVSEHSYKIKNIYN